MGNIVEEILRRFKDWSLFNISIDLISDEEFGIRLSLSKKLCYPEKNELKVKPLFAKLRFEKDYEDLTIYCCIYHYQEDKQYVIEEKKIIDKANISTILYLLKYIRKYLNKNIKYLKQKAST